MSEVEDSSIYNQHGRASQLPQYDDITIRRMEAINTNANLRTCIVGNRKGLYDSILLFHQYFGALFDSTYLEVEDKLEEDNKTLIKGFLNDPFKGLSLDNSLESQQTKQQLIPIGRLANEIHMIYEQALLDGGFRKLTYYAIKPEEKWRHIG